MTAGRVALVLPFLATLMIVPACSGIPISSIYKLRNFDPLATNIDAFYVAVRIPDKFSLLSNGVVLTIGTTGTERDAPHMENFYLQPLNENEMITLLNKYGKPRTEIFAFRIGPVDQLRFNTLRSKMKRAKANGATGSLSIDTKACRKHKEFPDKLLVSTFLKTEETDEFVPIILNHNLVEDFDGIDLGMFLPRCATS